MHPRGPVTDWPTHVGRATTVGYGVRNERKSIRVKANLRDHAHGMNPKRFFLVVLNRCDVIHTAESMLRFKLLTGNIDDTYRMDGQRDIFEIPLPRNAQALVS